MKEKLILKIALFTFCLTIFLLGSTYGQAGNKVATKYMRPSVADLFVEATNSRESVIIESFRKLPMVSKFNDHNFNFSDLKLSLPAAPLKPDISSGLGALKEYNSKIQEIEINRKSQLDEYALKASNPIVAKWWDRDSNGDFDYKLVSERGFYSASDADMIADKAAATSRIEMAGALLINKSYAIVYAFSNVKTMEEAYDAMDAAGAKLKNYKPVKRTEEGYQMDYVAYLYKLNYGDSVSAIFDNNYWTSSDQHNREKAQAWESATFPMSFIVSVNGSVSSTQSNDPNSAIYKLVRRKSLEELLQDMPAEIQDDAITKFSRKVEDFRVKAPVFQETPLSAKLGTKEGLYRDERFFIYEIESDKAGNQEKKRKGVARVSTVAKNDTISNGKSQPSVFKQQGGKSAYQGMLMESSEDLGVTIGVGYRMSNSDLSMGGMSAALEYNITRLVSKMLHKNFLPSGLYFGAGISYNMMKDLTPGYIITPTQLLTTQEAKWQGNTMSIEVMLSKEMYFTHRGNFYLLPSIAYGLSDLTFLQNGTTKISETTGKDVKDFQWSAYSIQAGLGFGINLHPNVTLLIKPMFVYKSAYTTGNSDALTQISKPQYINKTWGFDKVGQSNTSLPILLSLKIRL